MGKIALITGSNKGIGYSLSESLLETASEFSTIILTSRDTALGQAARTRLGHEDRTVYHKLDITSADDIQTLAAFIAERFGKIDVLVNNAAVYNKTGEFSSEIASSTLLTNFFGVKQLTEAFIPLLNPNGHIVNISAALGETNYLNNPDLASKLLSPNLTIPEIAELANEYLRVVSEGTWKDYGWPSTPYHVSKALINSYTRVLHQDLVKNGIPLRVNAVHPGWVRTDMGGPNALMTIEEGIADPLLLIRDSSSLSGLYWKEGTHMNFF